MDNNIKGVGAGSSAKRTGSPVTVTATTDNIGGSQVNTVEIAAESPINVLLIESIQANFSLRTKEQEWVDKEIENTAKSAQEVLFSIARGKRLKGKSIEKVIKALEAKGAEINAKDKDGMTALHVAAEKGQVEAIRKLIECGADIDM